MLCCRKESSGGLRLGINIVFQKTALMTGWISRSRINEINIISRIIMNQEAGLIWIMKEGQCQFLR